MEEEEEEEEEKGEEVGADGTQDAVDGNEGGHGDKEIRDVASGGGEASGDVAHGDTGGGGGEGGGTRLEGSFVGEGRGLVFVGRSVGGVGVGGDPLGRKWRYRMMQEQMLGGGAPGQEARRALVDMTGPTLLCDQVSVGAERYLAMTSALAAFRRMYQTRVCGVLARADMAVIALHAFLTAPRVQAFCFDPAVVGAVEMALHSTSDTVDGIQGALAKIDQQLAWDTAAMAHAEERTQALAAGVLGPAEAWAKAVEEDAALHAALAARPLAANATAPRTAHGRYPTALACACAQDDACVRARVRVRVRVHVRACEFARARAHEEHLCL